MPLYIKLEYNNHLNNTPMKHLFTSEKKRPSAKTIYFIKKLAYTYRALNNDESHQAYYVN